MMAGTVPVSVSLKLIGIGTEQGFAVCGPCFSEVRPYGGVQRGRINSHQINFVSADTLSGVF